MTFVHRLIHFVLLVLAPAAHAERESPCLRALIANGDARHTQLWMDGTPRSFEIVDLERGKALGLGFFRIEGRLLGGALTFDIKTVKADGQRSEVLSGRFLFDEMMRFLEDHVELIRGQWVDGNNLATFNELVRAGTTPEVAARRTWTGQQAARHGFRDVEVSAMLREDGSDYATVVVNFRKPAASPCVRNP